MDCTAHDTDNTSLWTESAPCLALPPALAVVAGCVALGALVWRPLKTAFAGPSLQPGQMGRGQKSLGWHAGFHLPQSGCPEATVAAASQEAAGAVWARPGQPQPSPYPLVMRMPPLCPAGTACKGPPFSAHNTFLCLRFARLI